MSYASASRPGGLAWAKRRNCLHAGLITKENFNMSFVVCLKAKPCLPLLLLLLLLLLVLLPCIQQSNVECHEDDVHLIVFFIVLPSCCPETKKTKAVTKQYITTWSNPIERLVWWLVELPLEERTLTLSQVSVSPFWLVSLCFICFFAYWPPYRAIAPRALI